MSVYNQHDIEESMAKQADQFTSLEGQSEHALLKQILDRTKEYIV